MRSVFERRLLFWEFLEVLLMSVSVAMEADFLRLSLPVKVGWDGWQVLENFNYWFMMNDFCTLSVQVVRLVVVEIQKRW